MIHMQIYTKTKGTQHDEKTILPMWPRTSIHHILLKLLVDHQLTLSNDQFILFDNKSFLTSPEAHTESVHLVVGDGLKCRNTKGSHTGSGICVFSRGLLKSHMSMGSFLLLVLLNATVSNIFYINNGSNDWVMYNVSYQQGIITYSAVSMDIFSLF